MHSESGIRLKPAQAHAIVKGKLGGTALHLAQLNVIRPYLASLQANGSDGRYTLETDVIPGRQQLPRLP